MAFLLGTWRGQGKGEYPTVESFLYEEEVRFWDIGKPFLAYTQRTWDPANGTPRHGEMGYWRPAGPKDVRRLERTIEVTGDVLSYTLRMAAVGVELTQHLAAELHREG